MFFPSLLHMEESSFIGTFVKAAEVSKAVAYFEKKGYRTIICELSDPERGTALPDP